MKIIRIFALPSHASEERTAGVDFVRVIQPMQALNGYKDKDVEFKVDIWQPNKKDKTNWLEVARAYDLLYLNYTNNAWAFAAMGALARKYSRKMVMDVDDGLWNILPDNAVYQIYKRGSEGLKNVTAILNEVDYVTCTNSYLKNVIAHNTLKRHENIKVFPNYIDLNLYKHRSPFKDTFQIQLTHFGSSSHFQSLQDEEFNKGIDMLFKEYPNVSFTTVGAFIPKYKIRWGSRYTHSFGNVDIYKWVSDQFPIAMDETDIIVAPLTDNVYNRSKSSIKFIEASSAKKPGVYQRIRQYEDLVENGKNGFLASTAQEWHDSIKKLIDDKELRRTMGEEAFKLVERDFQIQSHVKDFADWFKEILDT